MTPSDHELESARRECASDLLLDAHLAGELSGAASADLTSHLERCERCAERLRELDAFRAEAERLLPAAFAFPEPGRAPLPSGATRRTRWVSLLGGGGALAAAAATALWLGSSPGAHSDGERTKGGDRLAFYVSREGAVFEGGPGDTVRPGDMLTFSLQARAPSFVAVLSRDGQGRASVYYPSGSLAVTIPAGLHRLPEGVILDDAVGRESLYGIFCSSPVELEPIRRALETRGELSAPGCRVDVLSIEKRRP